MPPAAEIAPWTWREAGLALLLYVIATCLLFAPLLAKFASAIPGDNGDAVVLLWLFWAVPHSLHHGMPIFHNAHLIAPYGVDLVYYTNELLAVFSSLPVRWVAGVVPAYNAANMLAFAFSGWCFYLFCREIPCRFGAAFVAGLCCMLSPHMMAHLPGHLTLVEIQYVPLALFFWRRILRASRFTWRPALGLGLSVFAIAVTNLYLLIFTFVLGIVLTAAVLVENWRSPLRWCTWAMLLLAAGISISAALPWARAYMQASRRHDYSPVYPWAGAEYRIKPADFIKPPPFQTLWGKALNGGVTANPGTYTESEGYIGWACMILGLCAFVSRQHRIQCFVWLAGMLLFMDLSMGNRFTRADNPLLARMLLGRFLPEAPPFNFVRIPARFGFGTMFSASVLLALGINAIQNAIPRRKGTIAGACALLVTLDFLAVPIPVRPVLPSALYDKCSLQGDGTLLSFPVGIVTGSAGGMGRFVPQQVIDQLKHEKPMISGYVSKVPKDVLNKMQADRTLQALLALQDGRPAPEIPRQETEEFVRRTQLRWVVLQNEYRQMMPLVEFITGRLGMRKIHSFPEGDVYTR